MRFYRINMYINIECEDDRESQNTRRNRKLIDRTFAESIAAKSEKYAEKDEKVIIPINMRDGIILATGLGNEEWNTSAPHGSGRIMKREDVKSHFTVSSYKSEMKGIYTSCVCLQGNR